MRSKAVALAALVLSALPASVFALGLGEIQLRSSLNAPLDAEIELLSATPEELGALKAQLATRETFTRYGLDYPSYLTGVTLTTVRGTDGRNLLKLRSTAAITEPFATVLVEVNWPRGRLVREYTVLLDPPVYAPPAAAAAAPVAAPTSGDGARSGGIARPAAPAAEQQIGAPASASPAAQSAGGTYEVKRGDTLSRIVARLVGSDPPAQRRAMIATYQSNPRAFDGNINLLKSGVVLRLPEQSAIDAISAAEATAEVRRQSAAWQAARPAGTAAAGGATPAEDARLRLVPPQETGSATAAPTTPGAAGAESQAIRQRLTDLEAQLSESRRLLELRNAELAQLQARAAQAPATTSPLPAPVPAAPAEPAPVPAATPPAQTAPIPAPEPAPPVVAAPPAPAPAGSSFLDLLKAYWYIPVALIALLLAVVGLRAARARRESSFDSSLRGFGAEPGLRDFSSDTLPLRKPNITKEDESFVVEESGAHERPAFGGAAARTPRRVEVDEPSHTTTTPNIDSTLGLEQGDPLAEADFHMAYGLYDQAADLVRIAIQREPQRRDLKLKLLEVFFVWGNKEQFLQTARELAGTRDQSQPGEWEKVIIMGKQLAPEDALFSQGTSGSAGMAGVDLNLEGGQNRIDFDLLGEPSVELSGDGGVDLDIGSAFGDKDAAGGATVLDKDRLDFALDDPGRGGDGGNTATTRQMTQKIRDDQLAANSPTMLAPGPDSEGPTVEQPALRGGETVRQKVDTALKYGSPDQTAELALDDLGLDLGALEAGEDPSLEVTGEQERPRQELNLDQSSDAPTLVAGMDDESRRLIADAQANAETRLSPVDGGVGASGTWLFNEKDFLDPSADTGRPDTASTQAMPMMGEPPLDASPTAKLRAFDSADVDVDFDSLSTSGVYQAPSDSDAEVLDLDVGQSEPPESNFVSTQRLNADELALPDLEPATMSEVGTKLDLARAYMDMGDPEGARSILQEVLDEGSPTQKQEAQRLVDSIPG
jgi:pilus assembly protein FimV